MLASPTPGVVLQTPNIRTTVRPGRPEETPIASEPTPQVSPADLLGLLPPDSTVFVFVDALTVLRRASLRSHIEEEMDTLTSKTNGVISEELFRSAGVRSAAFSMGRGAGAAVLVGSFERFPEVLHRAANEEAQDRMEVEAVEIYRDLLILRVASDLGYPASAYIALLPPDTVVVKPGLSYVKEDIDRFLDDGEAPRSHSLELSRIIQAAQSPIALEPYRGVEVFLFQSRFSSLYLAVPGPDAMLLVQADGSSGYDRLKAMIDRRLDGGKLPEALAGLLAETGDVDFMTAQSLESESGAQSGEPFPFPTFIAHAGALEEDETSTLYAYWGFAGEEQAAQAMDFFSTLEDLGDLFFIYHSETGRPVGELRQLGRAVVTRVTAPDKDVPDLLLTD